MAEDAPGGLHGCNCNSANDCTAINKLCVASCEKGTPEFAAHCGCP